MYCFVINTLHKIAFLFNVYFAVKIGGLVKTMLSGNLAVKYPDCLKFVLFWHTDLLSSK